MLQVILLILKIIGIILLSVIFLILTGILLVVFVPARYRITADYHGTATAKVKMSWLLHIISVMIKYENGELKNEIRVFGVRYRKRNKTKAVRKPKKTKTQPINEPENTEPINEPSKTDSISEPVTTEQAPKKEAPAIEAIPSDEEEYTFWKKLKMFCHMLLERFKNIRYTLSQIYDKLIHVKENITYYVEFMQDDRNQNAFRLCLSQFAVILRHIKPRKYRTDIVIGTDDPATTGTILAVLGIVYPIFEGNLHVTPDFERTIFEAELYARGRIRASAMLRAAWNIYFNKDFKRMLGNFKKEDMK